MAALFFLGPLVRGAASADLPARMFLPVPFNTAQDAKRIFATVAVE